jgi:hypothetical protein
MFASKIAKTKAAADSTNKLAPQRSVVLATRPFGGGAVDRAHMLQRSIGNQATLRILAQRAGRLAGNERSDQHEQEVDTASLPTRGATPGLSWDFSRVPLFPPEAGIIQPKLVVGQVDDPLEHEADRVADQVMRMPDPEFSMAAALPQLSRKCAACEEEDKTLQTKQEGAAEAAANEVPGSVREVLRAPGQPLDPASRGFFEPRFRCDFSGVRIHSDGRAAESARVVGARAYTVGQNIVFDAGRHSPNTNMGQALLAHELTHTIQQTGGKPLGSHLPWLRQTQSGLLQRDPAPANKAPASAKKTYEEYVTEGAARLAGVTFPKEQKGISVYSPGQGLRETSIIPGTGDLTPETMCMPQVSASEKKSFDYWYDQRYWEPAVDAELHSCKLVLRGDKKDEPAKAIDELFDHQERWHVACAEFIQITHLYALRHTLGDEGFRQRVQTGGNKLELRRRGSTGVKTRALYSAMSPVGIMFPATGFFEPRSVEQLLADAPIGSRVRWTNNDSKALGRAYQNENTVKLGPDKYLAYPLSTSGLSRNEVESRVARETNPKADDAYIRKNIFISEIEYFSAP